jgi:hypothetical protein
MNADHTLRVIRETRTTLGRHSVSTFKRSAAEVTAGPKLEQLQHVLWMLDEMENWIRDQMTMDAKKWEKVQRWLGFVQGALWSLGIYTIDEMRKQNTPEVPPEGA